MIGILGRVCEFLFIVIKWATSRPIAPSHFQRSTKLYLFSFPDDKWALGRYEVPRKEGRAYQFVVADSGAVAS